MLNFSICSLFTQPYTQPNRKQIYQIYVCRRTSRWYVHQPPDISGITFRILKSGFSFSKQNVNDLLLPFPPVNFYAVLLLFSSSVTQHNLSRKMELTPTGARRAPKKKLLDWTSTGDLTSRFILKHTTLRRPRHF